VARCTAAWTKALEEGTEYAIEVRNRSRDGEYRWFLTRATPVRDAAGRIELWFGSTTDIHDSKAAELERERLLAEHQQQREFLESLIANAPVAIAVVQGTDLRYTLVNPTYQAIVGPDIPLLGRTYRDLFPEAADRGAEEGLRQVLRTGQRWSVRDFETPIPGRDGMTWWDSEVLTVPGVPDSLLILTWEITDRKRAEEALRRAKGASEAANRAKDEFLATLGHELRNPLGAIAGAVSVLSLGVKTDNETAEPREIIGRQTAHLSRLLDDLLDLTRLDTGKIVLQRRPLNLKALTERALGSLAEGGKAAQHAIAITGTGETLWVEGDPTRLEQVIFNLLDNAVKYTPPGGRITLTVNSEGAAAVVRVADTGIGMTPDALARVFEPFFQAESPHARPGGGLGLGLTLVKRLVELHGGDIAADSPGLGHGTQVRVRLPLTDAPGGPEAAPPSEAVAEPRRVLVIDDNSDMRTTLRMLLKLGGHHVDEAADGVQGLELLLRLRPDVAFIDLGLPGRDGYEVARAIRRAPGGQSLYLVALTGYGQPQDRQRGLEAGFNAYLVKPVYQSDLVRVLAAAADG
jgi:signal transduction histidine kinase